MWLLYFHRLALPVSLHRWEERMLISTNEMSWVSVLWGRQNCQNSLIWASLPEHHCLVFDACGAGSFLIECLPWLRLLQGMNHSSISVYLCPLSASTAPSVFSHVARLDNGSGKGSTLQPEHLPCPSLLSVHGACLIHPPNAFLQLSPVSCSVAFTMRTLVAVVDPGYQKQQGVAQIGHFFGQAFTSLLISVFFTSSSYMTDYIKKSTIVLFIFWKVYICIQYILSISTLLFPFKLSQTLL